MNDAEKVKIFDLLLAQRVIEMGTSPRLVGGEMKSVNWIGHGQNKEIVLGDFVIPLEAQGAKE